MTPVKWGVIGASKFALTKAVPGMLKSAYADVVAIASRDLAKAKQAASSLGIERAYGSYEALLEDPEIEAIYNPLPNHLHVPWSIRAVEAGKHVLCEKPLAASPEEIDPLIAARDRHGVVVGEAFMVCTHPQWRRVRELVASGAIGALRAAVGQFSYFNVDPGNIRNRVEAEGGALMDIGCYPVVTTRMVFGEEPTRVAAMMERDPQFGTDRLTSAILDFPSGQAVFVVSTQMVPSQRMQFFGSKGRIEVEIPFNSPPDRPTRIFVDETGELFGTGLRTEAFATCDQYAVQADEFSKAIRGEAAVPVGLEDSRRIAAVLAAIRRSAASGRWELV